MTITVQKELIKNTDLIAVPRTSYEAFLTWQKKIKSTRTFTPTMTEKKTLLRAQKNFTHGKYTTLTTLRHALGFTH